MPRQKVKNCGADILSAQYMVVDFGLIPQYAPVSKRNHTFCRRVRHKERIVFFHNKGKAMDSDSVMYPSPLDFRIHCYNYG
jgi:hypothetical protein